jgi:hypothetical protein
MTTLLGASFKQRSLNLEQFILGNIPQHGLIREGAELPQTLDPEVVFGSPQASVR